MNPPSHIHDDLGFLLRYDNVAWYEAGHVRILDRRIYPIRIEYVTCRTVREVTRAIADMVTQSGGPYIAAAMGMALAAHEAEGLTDEREILSHLEEAAFLLSHARPTTQAKMERVTTAGLMAAREALKKGLFGEPLTECLRQEAVKRLDEMHETGARTAAYLAERVPDKATIMTMCFAETYIGHLLLACRQAGKAVRLICPETRPYFQGARLTASVAADMGFEVTVISDNMPGYVMKEKKVDLFTSAADVITLDGHVVNKVGTFQLALCARYHGIPYYCTGNPNPAHPTIDTIRIEERDPEDVLSYMGIRTTLPAVKGYYPAFDITPPDLVTGIATDRGILLPSELSSYKKRTDL